MAGADRYIDMQNISDIHTLSAWLCCQGPPPSPSQEQPTVILLAGNAILHTATALFDLLATTPTLSSILVITGGIGHSTIHLYSAVAKHPRYAALSPRIHDLPEARVLELILREYHPELAARVESGDLTLLVEDESTNCGSNAVESKRVLDARGIWPGRVIVVQDPTMTRRTLAAVQRCYAEQSEGGRKMPRLEGWSTFTPQMKVGEQGEAEWNVPEVQGSRLWDTSRFFDLIMGEIPRLKDDENGYGPKGKGFIAHVDIPTEVEAAWERLRQVLAFNR